MTGMAPSSAPQQLTAMIEIIMISFDTYKEDCGNLLLQNTALTWGAGGLLLVEVNGSVVSQWHWLNTGDLIHI